MTAHPIDTEALAKRAGHVLFTQGPEQPAATARETCVLLDLLAAAEHRATRAETQSEARRINTAYWKERASAWQKQYEEDAPYWCRAAEQAETRIKAVQALADQADTAGDWTVCEARWPCPTIRAQGAP